MQRRDILKTLASLPLVGGLFRGAAHTGRITQSGVSDPCPERTLCWVEAVEHVGPLSGEGVLPGSSGLPETVWGWGDPRHDNPSSPTWGKWALEQFENDKLPVEYRVRRDYRTVTHLHPEAVARTITLAEQHAAREAAEAHPRGRGSCAGED